MQAVSTNWREAEMNGDFGNQPRRLSDATTIACCPGTFTTTSSLRLVGGSWFVV